MLSVMGDSPLPGDLHQLALVRHTHARRLAVLALEKRDSHALRLALKYAESATRLDSGKVDYWALLGGLYASMGEHALASLMAEDALENVLRLDPTQRKSRLLLARLNLFRGNYHAAIRHLQRLIREKAEPDLLKDIYRAFVGDLSYGKGVRFFRELGRIDSEMAGRRVLLALLLYRQGKTEKALQEVRLVADQDGAADQSLARSLENRWGMEALIK